MGCRITRQCSLKRYCITNATSNNQRLRSAGDNDGRLKSFFSNAVLCVSFKWQMDRSTRVQITSDRRSKRAWSNCVVYIPFILNGSPTECWLHTYNACVITTWRLRLRAPLVARKKCKNTKWFTQMVIYFTYRGDVIHFRHFKHPARGVDLVSVDFWILTGLGNTGVREEFFWKH